MDKKITDTRLTLAELPDILDAYTIASYLDICYTKALQLIKFGGIKYIKIGNIYRVSKYRFEEWLMRDQSQIIDLK